MSFQIVCYRGRSAQFSGALYHADGSPMTLGDADLLLANFGREGSPAALTLRSDQSTAAGSTVALDDRGDATRPAAYRILLAAADTALLALPCYEAEVARRVAGLPAGLRDQTVETGVLAVAGVPAAALAP